MRQHESGETSFLAGATGQKRRHHGSGAGAGGPRRPSQQWLGMAAALCRAPGEAGYNARSKANQRVTAGRSAGAMSASRRVRFLIDNLKIAI